MDHQTSEDNSVTLRHRDTQKQDRIPIDQLIKTINVNMENFNE